MSTFSGINQSARALSAAQRGLEVTGQNIANANTPGYSRQRVEQSASILNQTGQFSQKNVAGDGVVVTGLTRVTDVLATATARQDSATSTQQGATSTIWSGIEAALGDTGTTGLSKDLTNLSSAWNNLVKTGTDGLAGARSLVVTNSEAVAGTISSMDAQLQNQFTQLGYQAQTLASQANTAAANIAGLNTSIRETLASGASANELMDQRDQYLNQLADITGSRVVNRQNGTVDVFVGNATIVTGDVSYALTINGVDNANAQVRLPADQYTATIGGQAAGPVAGSLKGTLDGANITLKDQWTKLDSFTRDFTSRVNTAYGTATPFFTTSAGGTAITAHDLQVNSALVAAPSTLVDSTAGTSGRSVAAAVLGTFDATKSTWRANATTIAAATQSAENRADLASQVALRSGNVRDAVSGVNLDEEMTNLVSYQHAYTAAARVLSAMDEALQTLLTMTR